MFCIYTFYCHAVFHCMITYIFTCRHKWIGLDSGVIFKGLEICYMRSMIMIIGIIQSHSRIFHQLVENNRHLRRFINKQSSGEYVLIPILRAIHTSIIIVCMISATIFCGNLIDSPCEKNIFQTKSRIIYFFDGIYDFRRRPLFPTDYFDLMAKFIFPFHKRREIPFIFRRGYNEIIVFYRIYIINFTLVDDKN